MKWGADLCVIFSRSLNSPESRGVYGSDCCLLNVYEVPVLFHKTVASGLSANTIAGIVWFLVLHHLPKKNRCSASVFRVLLEKREFPLPGLPLSEWLGKERINSQISFSTPYSLESCYQDEAAATFTRVVMFANPNHCGVSEVRVSENFSKISIKVKVVSQLWAPLQVLTIYVLCKLEFWRRCPTLP